MAGMHGGWAIRVGTRGHPDGWRARSACVVDLSTAVYGSAGGGRRLTPSVPGMSPPMLPTALDRLRAGWRSLGCTPAEQLALGVLVAGALAALGVLWWAQRPARLAPPVGITASAAPGVGASSAPSAAPGQRTQAPPPPGGAAPDADPAVTPPVTVHVTGQVAAPGVYELPAPARVVDALAAAGGPSDAGVTDQLNLAAPLSDGAQVRVPGPGETPPPGGLVAGGAPAASVGEPAAPIDLNAADRATLETIPGIGPVTAERIISRRNELGGFSDVDDLLDIRGIGPATVEELRVAVVVR